MCRMSMISMALVLIGKRTPKSVKRRSSRVDFRLRNQSSPDVVLVMKALFRIFDPHNRVETNMYFVFAHDFVLALRYLHFSLLTYITDSRKFLQCLLFTDGRSQLQRYDISTKSVKRRMLKHRKWCFKYEPSSHEIRHCEQKYLFLNKAFQIKHLGIW